MKDKKIIDIINKDRIWIRFKKYIYFIIALIIILIILLIISLILNCFIYNKLLNLNPVIV